MAARAIWKGVIRFADIRIAVKLYSAVEDHSVHFRLLHRKDKSPVKQVMLNPETGEIVPFQETLRAYRTDDGGLVALDREDLDAVQPEPSRDIHILHFLPQNLIDHRWYERPYYLGPDGPAEDYFALADALEDSGTEGLARWVMRNKEYAGALRLYRGYPMLIALRYAEQVLSVEELEAPKGRPLDQRELSMARQLIGMLEAGFEPRDYADEYRKRVLEMIEAKQRGGQVKRPPRHKPAPPEDLTRALEASLRRVRHG